MELTNIVNPQAVKVVGKVTSKKRLFQELGEIAASVYGLDAAQVSTALQERENLGPTGVGHGIALPHARIDGLEQVVGVLLRLEHAIEFNSVDRLPVDLVFALFAPKDAGVEHLKALARVSRTMRNADTCAKLRANESETTLHAILTAGEVTQAA